MPTNMIRCISLHFHLLYSATSRQFIVGKKCDVKICHWQGFRHSMDGFGLPVSVLLRLFWFRLVVIIPVFWFQPCHRMPAHKHVIAGKNVLMHVFSFTISNGYAKCKPQYILSRWLCLVGWMAVCLAGSACTKSKMCIEQKTLLFKIQ